MAAVGIIEKEAVEKRQWVSRSWFTQTMGLMEMVPGPTATEMTICIGYKKAGVLGGILAGICYIYPAFLSMLALSWIYFRFGAVPSLSAFFYGIGPPAVVVLILAAGRLAMGSIRSFWHCFLFVSAFVFCYFFNIPVFAVIVLGGLAEALRQKYFPALFSFLPLYLLISPFPLEKLEIPWAKLGILSLGMLKAGSLLFGGGYVIVPFLAQDFVHRLGWMSYEEFLTGFALGKATPGPISITAAFMGFKAAGLSGAFLATVCVFLPCFAFLLLLFPFFERLYEKPWAQAFIRGVGVVTVGAILSSAAELIQGAFGDWGSVLLFITCLAASYWIEATWLLIGSGVVAALASFLYPALFS